MFKHKKADSGILGTTLFLILNLAFISLLLIFVQRSSQGALVYEEMYAKQISLFIDGADPGTIIFMDFTKAMEILKKNNKKPEDSVKINKEKNEVKVSLSGKGGHSFAYFSDYDVSFYFGGNNLGIVIGEKKNE